MGQIFRRISIVNNAGTFYLERPILQDNTRGRGVGLFPGIGHALPQGQCPSASQFWGSLLFMHTVQGRI